VRYPLHQAAFHGMGKRTVADIVQQDGYQQPLFFLIGNNDLFLPQYQDGMSHQVHAAQGVVETGMVGSGIYQVRKAHLRDAPQSLEKRVGNQIEN